jgi:PQQ-dependent dehydrogenase (methanol/ethanol family)
MRGRLKFGLAAALLLAGCGPLSEREPTHANVDEARLLAADDEPGQWMTTGRTYAEQRWSPLTQINTESVRDLGLAWYADFDSNRGQEATPLVIDGVVYVTTAWSKVYAFDARTGRELWTYDPEVPGEWAVNVCCDVVNRGAAAWNGKIYVGTIDGRLVALDAATGEVVWSVLTIDPASPYSITGAPRVVKGRVLIGNAGAEYGVRGYVSAYDAETGALDWRFYTVPGNPADGFENPVMEAAAETWNGEWWALGGGGTVWDAIVYDPEVDLVFIGTGNGSPWNAEVRSPGGGDNLFLSSIVALDPDTGEYVWHYQTTPNETWDYTATQPIMTADLGIDGEMRHVVMQAPKNGYFYVLDAATGELISAEPFVDVNWALGFDPVAGRPIENPRARFDRTGEGATVAPGPEGAHTWRPMAYSILTGLVYIPAADTTFGYVADPEFSVAPLGFNVAVDFNAGFALFGRPDQIPPRNEGLLIAWDPVNQREAWRVSYGFGRAGGALATAGGIVFAGDTLRGELVAYRATTGEKLWSAPANTGIVAGPASFTIDGEQMVAVVAGVNPGDYYTDNESRLLVFKLGGSAELPPPPLPRPPPALAPPPNTAAANVVARGGELYGRYCGVCHGDSGQSRGVFPDLRYSDALHDAGLFAAVVIDGALAPNGMASFAEALSAEDADAVRHFVIAKANEGPTSPFGGPALALPAPPPSE